MVIVEGVARGLDPSLNLWTAAEPIAREWVEANLGLMGRLKDAGQGAEVLGRVLADAPRVLEQAERTALALAATARDGWRLDEDTVKRLATANSRAHRWQTLGIWTAALGLVATALALWR